MRETFDLMIPWVFKDEGEYSNDEGDDGGPTRLGITYIDLSRYRRIDKRVAYNLVKDMSPDECKAIYKLFYWDPLRCDDLPRGVDYFIFDSGLHSGAGAAAKWLQYSLGVKADGKIGPATLRALEGKSSITLLGDLIERRRRHLRSHKKWPLFSRGWTNRVNKVKIRAFKLDGIPVT